MPALTHKHRETLQEIFRHPTSHNIDWVHVIHLLEHIGEVVEASAGKFRVELGESTVVLRKPRHKDIDIEMVVKLRHRLQDEGWAPESA